MAERPVQSEEELSLATVKARAVRASVALMLRQVVLRVMGIVGMLVLARLLSPTHFGLFAVAQFTVLLFERVGNLGLPTALTRQQGPLEETQLAGLFTVQLVLVTLSVTLVLALAPAIAGHFGSPEATMPLRVMTLALLCSAARTIPTLKLQRALRHDRVGMVDLAEYLLYLAVAIPMALAGYGLWALVAAQVARGACGALLLNVLMPWRPRLTLSLAPMRPLLPFALPIQLAEAVNLAQRSLVPVLVGTLFGVAAVGHVNLARTLLDAVAFQPLSLLGQVQFRVFARIQDDAPRTRRTFTRLALLGVFMVLLPLTVVVSSSDALIAVLLGAKWAATAPLIVLLALAYLAYGPMVPALQVLKARGDRWISLRVGLTTVAVSVLATFALAPMLGVAAFAVGLLVALPTAALVVGFRARDLWSRELVVALFALVLAGALAVAAVLLLTSPLGDRATLALAALLTPVLVTLFAGLFTGHALAEALRLLGGSGRAAALSGRAMRLFERLALGLR